MIVFLKFLRFPAFLVLPKKSSSDMRASNTSDNNWEESLRALGLSGIQALLCFEKHIQGWRFLLFAIQDERLIIESILVNKQLLLWKISSADN